MRKRITNVNERMILSPKNGRQCKLRRQLWLGCLLFLGPSFLSAQNLVPNPSFEEYDVCPNTIGFQPGDKPLDWEKWLWSPDYFHSCAGSLNAVDTVMDVPLNGFGFQYAKDGEAYVGMATFQDDYREYVGCELTEPLLVGETYQLSFWGNVATGGNYWNPKLASNNLGLLFTMTSNIWTGLSGPPFSFRNYAHLYSSAVLADTVNWVQVAGSFTADSAYRYLVIGNFFEDTLTDTIGLEGPSTYAAYYFVDAVCVTEGATVCPFGTGLPAYQEDALLVWPNPVNDILHLDAVLGSYSILDAMGRVVITGTSAATITLVDVARWPVGQYVLRHEGNTRIDRFVVIH